MMKKKTIVSSLALSLILSQSAFAQVNYTPPTDNRPRLVNSVGNPPPTGSYAGYAPTTSTASPNVGATQPNTNTTRPASFSPTDPNSPTNPNSPNYNPDVPAHGGFPNWSNSSPVNNAQSDHIQNHRGNTMDSLRKQGVENQGSLARSRSRVVPHARLEYPQNAEAQGCSKEAWDSLVEQHNRALKDYEQKMENFDIHAINAIAVNPNAYQGLGCFADLQDELKGYIDAGKEITNRISSGGMSNALMGVLSSMVKNVLKSSVDKLKNKACQKLNNAVNKVKEEFNVNSGIDKILSENPNIGSIFNNVPPMKNNTGRN